MKKHAIYFERLDGATVPCGVLEGVDIQWKEETSDDNRFESVENWNSCRVELTDRQLICSVSGPPYACRFIPLFEIYVVLGNTSEDGAIELTSLNLITNKKEKIIIRNSSQSIHSNKLKEFTQALKRNVFRLTPTETLSESSVDDEKKLTQNNNRKLMIFINPKSGSGQSMQNFEKIVKPMLLESHIGNNFTCIISKHAGHIREYCEHELDLNVYNEIITCGGDGTLNEAINGILLRLEKEGSIDLLKKIRFSVIPSGSGNAMSSHFQKNLIGFNATTTDSCLVKRAGLFICRGLSSPLDVWAVFQPNKGRSYGIANFSYGGIADVDLGTEFIRFIGDLRYILGSIYYAFFGRYYSGNLTCIIPKRYMDLKKQNTVDVSEFKYNHSIASAFSGSVETIRERTTRLDAPFTRHFLSKELVEMGLQNYHADGFHEVNFDEYEKVEEKDQEYAYMFASNVSHAAADFVASHISFHNDSLIDLMFVKKPASPFELLSILMSCETGEYHKHSKWMYRKIKAFYFKPTSSKESYLTVDGEAVQYAPIIVENMGCKLNFVGGEIL